VYKAGMSPVDEGGSDSREWHGVPGTGKPFDHYGFLMMRVCRSALVISRYGR
jgi:hypothetical protein